MRRRILIILILICIILLFISNGVSAKEKSFNKDEIEVLFITSFNNDFISFANQIEGIKDGFNNNANIRVEYMDLKTFENKQSEENFYNAIKYILKNYDNIDVIIAGDDEATEFCIKYRDDLFNDIPISFLGVQDWKRRESALENDLVSGVTEVESIRENIEFIKKFHPNVDTITFVDCYGIQLYEDILSEYEEFTFNWIITKDIPEEEIKMMLSNLDKNDAVIELYVQKFKNTGDLDKSYVSNIIAESCNNIPIYNVLEYDISEESVGGKVISHYNQGKMAAEIASKLLSGEDEKKIYINDDSANEFIFNYKALRKFGIKVKDLPSNAIIINNPFESIKLHKRMLISVLVLFLGLINIIISLIWYISYRKKYERTILKAMKNAEDISNIKSHFISNISHELKTPINVINSAIQLIKVNNISGKDVNNYLEIINNNCNRLLRMISNTIDVHKSELNEIKLELTKVNVVEVIEDLVMALVPYTDMKNLELIFDTNLEEIILEVDIKKIERIVLNLLSNAIKFSKEKGKIRVNLILEEYFYIIVEDEGIGIDKDGINYIFDKFTQINNSLSRENEGSGIGLAIVKSFVELHKGTISVDSKVNEGTKFIIKLPIEKKHNENIINYNKEKIMDNIKIELSDIYL